MSHLKAEEREETENMTSIIIKRNINVKREIGKWGQVEALLNWHTVPERDLHCIKTFVKPNWTVNCDRRRCRDGGCGRRFRKWSVDLFRIRVGVYT